MPAEEPFPDQAAGPLQLPSSPEWLRAHGGAARLESGLPWQGVPVAELRR